MKYFPAVRESEEPYRRKDSSLRPLRVLQKESYELNTQQFPDGSQKNDDKLQTEAQRLSGEENGHCGQE